MIARKQYLADQRNYSLKRRYGISAAEYDKMFADQRGLCFLCEKPHKHLYVDHNHRINQVRKLLCPGCNTFIGGLETRGHLLRKALNYIKPRSSSLRTVPALPELTTDPRRFDVV